MGKKKKKARKAAKKERIKEVVDSPDQEDDNASGFGGLPDRDLKKNLGCGG